MKETPNINEDRKAMIEIADDLVDTMLESLGCMANKKYLKLHEFDLNENNYIIIADVVDDKEPEGHRIETKIISRLYFDERCGSANEIVRIIYGEEPPDVVTFN